MAPTRHQAVPAEPVDWRPAAASTRLMAPLSWPTTSSKQIKPSVVQEVMEGSGPTEPPAMPIIPRGRREVKVAMAVPEARAKAVGCISRREI